MPRDEFRRPLKRRSLGERLWARRPSPLVFTACLMLAVFLGGGLWLSRIPRPFAGEPVVLADIPAAAELVTASITPATDAPAESDAASTEDVIDQSAAEIIPVGEAAPQEEAAPPEAPDYEQEATIIVAPNRPLRKAPVDAVTERNAQGPLPRISGAGKKPFDVYSQVTPMAVLESRRPKIVLVLGGMGLNQKLTRQAIEKLPGDVTLGFAPYGDDLQSQVNKARARGHEILLQVPMEPVGYPGTNPGPNTLLTDATPEDNLKALTWHMSRLAGYSGITNYMGARLLGEEDALRPVMKELKARGLVYLENGTGNPTLSAKLGQEVRLPVRNAGLVIDADPTAPAIAAALEQLEQEAIATGWAIGTGAGLEVTIETVAEWIKTLQEKGILLVPVSAAYKERPA